ncbi:ADP-ribosylation factor guanine nucleotide-exchange factor 1(brefeldin A-inhibited) [Trypanosoma rangeli]|uniref:ADP-ribosylation factor guanine nucleotide-exchange factor 1(Brefeldin A-inhibited) n=1 Tax=Trypanosoma rangeli TaxID=5698 RepID=A0A422N8G3_TRYRA|nr:ADP-ribosylation factor guanine nucleotide-exchange factor 1(brefeldin A-inhibited) [Trypanosoma rangeli]RNF01732.1 ADP-ribosylation factor guanine nucleotide-exchange factor 1(brefeldin A-inhibited) [Trypanosoma rangeli]|eukprot:RNF01732.1 ADP-ribosylation factor guanine nucleotide-exchange factor 1(brefeldin A-inhibited) [Trypanosoma rangeli]
MSWRYEEVTVACGKALSEERNGRRRFLLNVIAKDLAELGSIVGEKTGQKVHEANGEASLRTDNNNIGSEDSLLSRVGFVTQLVLVENCGSRFSTKGLIALLEFAAVLLNSGLIPTSLVCVPPEISIPESASGRTGVFFSKLLGGGTCATWRSAQNASVESATAETEIKNEAVNVFTAVVEGILVIARHIQGKDVNDQLLFTLVTALQASAVPSSGRTSLSEKQRDDYNNYFLAVRGGVLLQVFKELFGVVKRNNVIFPLVEEAKSALNCIAKTLSKAIEYETTEVSNEEGAVDTTAGGGYQTDAARIMEYCCSLTGSSESPSCSPRNQGTTVGVIAVPNDTSIMLLTALGIILHLTVNGGPTFRNSKTILSVVKFAVIPCTLTTALLKDLGAFRLSVNVLLTCTMTFGHLMVNETETIFRHLFFRVLESKTSSLTQKSIVVEAFRRYIEEPQNLIALFLNYDCNTSSQSVYEQMIGYLAALSVPFGMKRNDITDCNETLSGRIVLDISVPEPLQRNALETLLLVVYSNLQWIERFECDQNISIVHASTFNSQSGIPELPKSLDKRVEHQGEIVVSASVESGNDPFVHALRVKDAFRKFTYLMNDVKDFKAAIEFLTKEPLLLPSLRAEVGEDETKYSKYVKVGELALRSGILKHSETTSNGPIKTSENPEEISVSNAESIALFLKEKEDYIDKLVLGEYFAKSFRDRQSRMIFVKWIEQHSFAAMTLDAALRLFLGGFKLLGEAEVVDKTMELFAAQYCKENPSAFHSANTAFILSFSICMLNTDAHSPHVKNKMTLEEFTRNNKGIDEGNDVDPDLLKGIYARIVGNEIKLRPSKFVSSEKNIGTILGKTSSSSTRISSGLLESIPILKHFAPVARRITDTVMIPLDAAGNALFNTLRRKQEEIYQTELRSALKDVMEALDTANALKSSYVEATRIENAIPMWGITVDYVVRCLLCAFENFFSTAESTVMPAGVQGFNDSTQRYMDVPDNREYFDLLLRGVVNTIRVCCDFGNISHAEDLIERLFSITQLSSVVVLSQQPIPCVSISNGISKPRIELLATLLNLFLVNGASLTTRGWRVAYTGVSLLDLISNGLEGIWRRQCRRPLLGEVDKPPPDTWFKNLEDVPPSFDKGSIRKRATILEALRCFSSVDTWLERLFDATRYPSQTQAFMSNALVSVCENELRSARTFALTKLLDFLTVCASFSSRMQWRDLWTNANKVFTVAGTMAFDIANSALGGLRIIALSYLMREELLNYSFQKEVLMPFESILMGNQDVHIRQKVIEVISELVEFRTSRLASGWSVVFSILSHCAMIPEVVKSAWELSERVITLHVALMKDCFGNLVFCLTSFACNKVDEEVALLGISYLRACGHWLQFGLEPPPEDVRNASAVAEWSGRFKDADNEANAAQFNVGLPRVTLSTISITSHQTLEKPRSLTAKTNYHLWMSLLEGMSPIISLNLSVRVRAHVICSLWALIEQYAVAFATNIQESLFTEILRPVLFNLLMHVPVDRETVIDPVDYKLLALLTLKSMFLACRHHPHLLHLACKTFLTICTSAFSLEHVQSGLIDVILRICVDLDPRGFATCLNSSEATSELWVSRLLHELLQVGHIDVIHFKRTSGWNELHHSIAATTLSINFDSNMGDEARTRVIDTVLTALIDGVAVQLSATMHRCSSQEEKLLCFRAMRRTYLVIALFSSADSTGKVFSRLLTGVSFSSSSTIPEQQLLIPYICVLIEFVFVLRSAPPIREEIQALQEAINVISQTIRESREFCIRSQSEYISALENEKAKEGTAGVFKKQRGRSFIDIFRSGRAPLSCLSQDVSHTVAERVLNEWRYLTHTLGLRYAFTFDGVTANCITADCLHDLILLFPSELEEELVEPFICSCWEELDVGVPLMGVSAISQTLIVLERKRSLPHA